MNIHHLELFYHVVKNRGVSAAARHIPYGIQQPAISGQVRALEKDLDLELFQRRPFALKPAGQTLFTAIEPFFEALEFLPSKIRGEAISRVRLAAPATILRDHFPPLLSAKKSAAQTSSCRSMTRIKRELKISCIARKLILPLSSWKRPYQAEFNRGVYSLSRWSYLHPFARGFGRWVISPATKS